MTDETTAPPDEEQAEEETLQTQPLTAAGEEVPKPYEGVPVLLMGEAATEILEQPPYEMEIAKPPEPPVEEGEGEAAGEGEPEVTNPIVIPSDEELEGMLKSDLVNLGNDLGIDSTGLSKAEVISAIKSKR